MRRRRKISVASVNGSPDFKIKEHAWAGVEKGYRARDLLHPWGNKLPKNARDEIVEATRHFLWWATFELNAVSVNDVDKLATAVRKSGRKFLDDLGRLLRPGDATQYLQHLIEKQPSVREGHHKIRKLFSLNASLLDACCRAERELRECKGFEDGAQWKEWVCKIASVLAKLGLDCTVRKDASGETASPFVILVRELQRRIPQEYQRHTQSDGALAQQLSLAIRGLRKRQCLQSKELRLALREKKQFGYDFALSDIL